MNHPSRQIDALLPDRWLAAKQQDAPYKPMFKMAPVDGYTQGEGAL